MGFILMLALVVPPMLALSVWLKRPFAQCAAPLVLSVIAVAYALSLLGLVWLAPWVMYLLFAGGCAYLVYAVLLKKRVPLTGLLSVGLVAFVAMGMALWWLCRGHMFVFWDDFSHWALAAKNMYYLNDLYTLPSAFASTYSDYPPAATIWVYTLLKAVPLGFREDLAMYAQGIFTMSLLVYPLSGFSRKKIGVGAVCAFALFVLPAAINSDYYTRLLTDGLLGVLLAFVLLAYFLGKGGKYGIACAALGCFVLSITKASGIGLALMACVIILIDMLFLHRKQTKERLKQSRLLGLLCLAGPMLAVVAGWASWAVHKAMFAVSEVWDTGALTLEGLGELFSGTAPAYRYEVLDNFVQNVFVLSENGGYVHFPSAGWFLIYAALGAAVYLLNKKGQRAADMLLLSGAACVHALFLVGSMFNYMFVFSQSEAVSLASFYRYEGTVVTACLLVNFALLLLRAAQHRLSVRMLGCAGTMVSLLLFTQAGGFVQSLISAPTNAARTQQERVISQHSAQRVASLGQQEPRVYFVSINDDRWALMRLIYELVPIGLSNPGQQSSIATANHYGEGEYLSGAIYSPEEWGEVLAEQYDYVYLHNIDGYFTTYYRPLFENEDDIINDAMLMVVRSEEGDVTLQRIS